MINSQHAELRKVDIYVRGSTDFRDPKHPGYYTVLIIDVKTDKGKHMECFFPEDTTPNRLMILGALTAIQSLKYPCDVTLYTTAPIGLQKAKGPNGEMLRSLIEAAKEVGHTLTNRYEDPELVRSRIRLWENNKGTSL